ncbi:PREDICTED: 52 kDa repressor of the inhibitor of the protein kinase-like [Priapulus caudatus]|uniref:52 kDa repressor of the inhibitor of the protein kinase-like n=1 Tax=Priapulus caudatus TaxID=37621 RepID=A0ABM1EGP7_PRICU|nr:PREDICTED: 52 kDa repressor of the inhibitor of the protein kinase-like [Priapulus caudatus]
MASTSTSSAHCSAPNCSNRQCKRPDLSFFRFPKNTERCQQWVQSTRRQDLLNRPVVYLSDNCRLCSEHFELDQFSNKQTKNRLTWNAVPTLFDMPNPLKHLSTTACRSLKRKLENIPSSHNPSKKQRGSDYTQTEHSYCLAADQIHENAPSSVSPPPDTDDHSRALKKERQRTFRLKKRVEQLKQSIKKEAKESETISDLIRGAGKFLQEPALSFFASQLRNASGRRRARGRRWSYSDKEVALSLYHQSPHAYHLCQRIFTLPSVTSLHRW